MTDKAKVRFDAIYISNGEVFVTVDLECSCRNPASFKRDEYDIEYGGPWIIECPACHRRYEVGVIEVEAM